MTCISLKNILKTGIFVPHFGTDNLMLQFAQNTVNKPIVFSQTF